MASVSGTSSSSILNSLSGKRLTGLASGLDTESLIENMTLATRTKIAKQYQNKQLLQWKMEAYRSISSKIIAFQNKFTSYTSATNLRGTAIFSKNIIEAAGEYSKYIKVSGNGKNADKVSIAGVEQLAKQTSYVSSDRVSTSTLSGKELTGTEVEEVSSLAGKSFTFSYNNKDYSITLDSSKTYKTMDEVAEEINTQLSKIDYGADQKLSDHIKVSTFDGGNGSKRLEIGFASDDVAAVGNTIKITGASKEISSTLGLTEGLTASGKNVITGKMVTEADLDKAITKTTLGEILEKKEFTFSYNGKSKTITLPGKEEFTDKDGNVDMDKLKQTFQSELDEAFGSGRIKVGLESKQNYDGQTVSKLTFKTTTPDGKDDNTSTLVLSGGDSKALKTLGFEAGASNRLNTGSSLDKSGFKFKTDDGTSKGINDYAVRIRDNISGKEYVIDKTTDGKAFDENTSIDEIIRAINESDANVNVTYLSTSDKLSIQSTQEGASGDFAIVGTDGKDTNLGQALFGKNLNGINPSDGSASTSANDYTVTEGQDAIIWVDFDGEGGEGPTQIKRGSNTFDLNGMSVTVTGTFNVTKDETTGQSKIENLQDQVTFNAKPDYDKITDTVKEMVEAYNEIVELSNKLVGEKPNRDYPPLTDEQKEEMSEDEIKSWNEKAKAGMLFNNSEVRGFTNEIRFLFSQDSASMAAFEAIGIKTSSTSGDNGKITFDETKFRAALESDVDNVCDMFTALEESYIDENGKKVVTQKAGVMANMKEIFDKYAATDTATKGIFVQAAGAEESPLSMLNNSLQDQMDDIDDLIDTLNDKLKDETERYYQQFSSLEVYINNMNSQSSWLSQQFGG